LSWLALSCLRAVSRLDFECLVLMCLVFALNGLVISKYLERYIFVSTAVPITVEREREREIERERDR
jgi:hypothetical protein